MTNETVLVSDNEKDLLRTAQLLAAYQGKPFYIARMVDKKYKITSLLPHSSPWKRENLEWIRTVLPVENKDK